MGGKVEAREELMPVRVIPMPSGQRIIGLDAMKLRLRSVLLLGKIGVHRGKCVVGRFVAWIDYRRMPRTMQSRDSIKRRNFFGKTILLLCEFAAECDQISRVFKILKCRLILATMFRVEIF